MVKDMRSRNRIQRAAVAGAVIAVVVVVVVAVAAGGFYLLSSETSARTSGSSTGSTASSRATGSAVWSSVASIVTTTSVGAQNLTALFENLSSGLNEPQYLIGNYSELSYVLSIESLNHSSGADDYSSTYSVIGPTTPDGVPATKVAVSFSNESTDGGILRNDTQQYTIDLDRNGTVVQLYNETTHEYKQIMNPDPNFWLLTQGTEEAYGGAIYFFQNSTFLQQAGSGTIGSTTLAVSSFRITPAYFSSGGGNFPGDTFTIGIGIAPGTTLHIPTSIVEIGETSPGNSSSWERVTFTGVTTG